MASLGSNRSQQQSQQQSFGQSFVDPSQAPFLQFLRQAGVGQAADQLGPGGIGDVAQGQADELGGIGRGFLDNLQGVAGGGQLPGQDFLQQRLSEQNPFLNEQISQLGTDISQQFQQSILPGIRRGAQAVGGLGGARQGVAEGLASQGASLAFAQQSANLRFQDVGQRQQAASALQSGGIAQGQLQAGAAQAGLGGLGGLAQLGLSPFQAQFAPLAQLSQLIGGPTVLSQQQSRGASSGRSSGFNFGIA